LYFFACSAPFLSERTIVFFFFMPKLTPELIAERRQGILRACLKQFARRGFHRTSMRDLCGELKLSAGALYCYFPSKEAIIEAMINQDRERWLPFFATLSADLSFRDQLDELETWAQGCSIGNAAEGDMLSLWWQVMAEATTNPKVATMLSEHYTQLTTEITKLVQRAQENGEVSRDFPARMIALFMISAFDGLFARVAIDPQVNFTLTAREFKRLILTAVLPLQPPNRKKTTRKP
jgi:TetR/AcrR family transcriptional regulator, repressor for uid operon